LLTLAVLIGLFLLLRKVALWYWKIDRMVALLEKIAGEQPVGIAVNPMIK
jgi:hypothetical protein